MCFSSLALFFLFESSRVKHFFISLCGINLTLRASPQEVLVATLDLEDVRSYRAEISSRNLAVRILYTDQL